MTLGDVTRVRVLPTCDICRHPSKGGKTHPAAYDAKTVYGQWANMCEDAFQEYGVGLGTGKGQRLVLEESRGMEGPRPFLSVVDEVTDDGV